MVCLTGFSFWYLYCLYSSKIAGAEAKPGRQGRLSNSCIGPLLCLPKPVQWNSDKETGFWGSPYVISFLLLAWKGREMSGFLKKKMKATPTWADGCFPCFFIPWTNISEKQAWFGKISWLRVLQSYMFAKSFFIFLFHFLHLKQGEGIVLYFLLLYEANGVGGLWINGTGGSFLPSVSRK